VKFPAAIDYNSVETLLSLFVAILFTGVGLFIASAQPLGVLRIPIGGILMGCGIGGMHYLGMSAIRGCGLIYDFNGVALSLAVAIGASTVALWFTFRQRGVFETLIGGFILGVAISGMHYTGMYATSFYPIESPFDAATPLLSQKALALAVAAAAITICCMYLLLFSSMLRRET